jgi:hypothetical protein
VNGIAARCRVFWLDARSEEGEYPLWSLIDERQSSRPKIVEMPGLIVK